VANADAFLGPRLDLGVAAAVATDTRKVCRLDEVAGSFSTS
jgi:hypothetical protein